MLKIFILGWLVAFCSSAQALTADEILDKSEAVENVASSVSELTQIVTSSSGQKRESKMKGWSMDNGDKSLIEYIAPARIKGMKILMLNDGDDIWSYSNRTNRVRKIASHQKKNSVNGSDFSYGDMAMRDMRKDYSAKLLGEEKKNGLPCYKLELNSQKKSNLYSKLKVWINKENFLFVQNEYYDEHGELWKVLTADETKKIGEHWTITNMTMNNVQKNSKTEIIVNNINYNAKISEKIFSQRQLKR